MSTLEPKYLLLLLVCLDLNKLQFLFTCQGRREAILFTYKIFLKWVINMNWASHLNDYKIEMSTNCLSTFYKSSHSCFMTQIQIYRIRRSTYHVSDSPINWCIAHFASHLNLWMRKGKARIRLPLQVPHSLDLRWKSSSSEWPTHVRF